MEDFNPIEDEIEMTRKFIREGRWNIEEVLDFTKTHLVQVVVDEGYSYLTHISDENGKGYWGTAMTPMFSLFYGIEQYKANNKKLK